MCTNFHKHAVANVKFPMFNYFDKMLLSRWRGGKHISLNCLKRYTSRWYCLEEVIVLWWMLNTVSKYDTDFCQTEILSSPSFNVIWILQGSCSPPRFIWGLYSDETILQPFLAIHAIFDRMDELEFRYFTEFLRPPSHPCLQGM